MTDLQPFQNFDFAQFGAPKYVGLESGEKYNTVNRVEHLHFSFYLSSFLQSNSSDQTKNIPKYTKADFRSDHGFPDRGEPKNIGFDAKISCFYDKKYIGIYFLYIIIQ